MEGLVKLKNPNAKLAKARLAPKNSSNMGKDELSKISDNIENKYSSTASILKFLNDLNLGDPSLSLTNNETEQEIQFLKEKLAQEEPVAEPYKAESQLEKDLKAIMIQFMTMDQNLIETYMQLTRENSISVLQDGSCSFEQFYQSLQNNTDSDLELKFSIKPETLLKVFLDQAINPLHFLGIESVKIRLCRKEDVIVRYFDEMTICNVISPSILRRNAMYKAFLKDKRSKRRQVNKRDRESLNQLIKLQKIKEDDKQMREKILNSINRESRNAMHEMNILRKKILKNKKNVFDIEMPDYEKMMNSEAKPLLEKINIVNKIAKQAIDKRKFKHREEESSRWSRSRRGSKRSSRRGSKRSSRRSSIKNSHFSPTSQPRKSQFGKTLGDVWTPSIPPQEIIIQRNTQNKSLSPNWSNSSGCRKIIKDVPVVLKREHRMRSILTSSQPRLRLKNQMKRESFVYSKIIDSTAHYKPLVTSYQGFKNSFHPKLAANS